MVGLLLLLLQPMIWWFMMQWISSPSSTSPLSPLILLFSLLIDVVMHEPLLVFFLIVLIHDSILNALVVRGVVGYRSLLVSWNGRVLRMSQMEVLSLVQGRLRGGGGAVGGRRWGAEDSICLWVKWLKSRSCQAEGDVNNERKVLCTYACFAILNYNTNITLNVIN